MSKMIEELKYMLIVLGVLYLFVGQITAWVFFIEYAQLNSTIKSLTLGPLIAEYKGLLWPVYI